MAVTSFQGLPNSGVTPKVDTKIMFTQQQVDWLDSQFGEKLTNATATDAELRHNAGQRSVIQIIKTRIQR